MTVEIGAQGFAGIALEADAGVYTAPTKFFPIMSESLEWTQDTRQRRVIRGTADVIGAVPGNGHVEGDIEMELLTDVHPYFLRTGRTAIEKTDTAGVAPFTYVITPLHNAVPAKTASITVVRNGVPFGYTGCVLGQQSYGVDNVTPTVTFNMVGRAEAEEAAPVPNYANDEPFGAGDWEIEIPTAAQVFDTDGFSLDINDNAEAQMRLKNALGAQFVSFGERETTLSVDRDFESRTEYDAFKAVTAKSVTIDLTHDDGNKFTALLPVAHLNAYPVSLDGVGDLIRASVEYFAAHDAGIDGAYQLTVITDEDITL